MRFFPQFPNSCSVCAKPLPGGVFAENEDFAIAGKCFCGENGCEGKIAEAPVAVAEVAAEEPVESAEAPVKAKAASKKK